MSADAITVLIVDDEAPARARLREILSDLAPQWPHRVVGEAANAPEALAQIESQQPMIALLDVQMPGKTGLELARAIKADPDLRAIQVVILTAKAQESDYQAGLAAGADLYLTKPFSPLELLNVVAQALGGV